MNCPNCNHQVTIVGVAQLAALCGKSPAAMSAITSRRTFPEPDGDLGKRRVFWVLENISGYLLETGLLEEEA